MRSLFAPLIIGLVISLAVVLGVQWSIFRTAVDDMMMEYIAGELAQEAEEMFGSLTENPNGEWSVALTHLDPPFLRPYSGKYYQLQVDNGTIVRSPSLVGATLAMTAAGPGRRQVDQVPGPQEEELLLSTTGYMFKGHAISIGVADDLKPIRSRFQRLLTRYAQVTLVFFMLLVVLQVMIVRLALRALRPVVADVSRLERGEITQLREQVPIEVLPLVREINRLLALLARRLQRSRESLGNLAHALKSPLTVLKHMVDGDLVQCDAELARQMTEQLEILRGRIDTELRRARVAGGGATGAPVDIAAEITGLVNTLRKLYRERQLDIACRIDQHGKFNGDREDFLELCGNLLDNACKWARSRVLVTVHHENGMVLIVEDDGPGCSAGFLDQIAQRGVRLDESTEGHGLGLAIVASIASSYDADVRFGQSPELGGFAVTVTFPISWPGARS
jgi:signal transduction histidine kinase